MELTNNIIRNLRQFELTEYEAKAYVALLSLNKTKAKRVVELTGIPYSKIYFTLNNLEIKGWIEVQRGRPSTYRAIPPRNAITAAKELILRKMKNAEVNIVYKLDQISAPQTEAEKGELWRIRGFTNVLRKIEDMLLKAKYNVFIGFTTTQKDILQVLSKKWMKILKMLMAKGVDIKIMLYGSTEDIINYLEALVDSGMVRLYESEDPRFMELGVMIDNNEVIFGGFGSGKNYSAMWSEEKGYIFMLKEIFEIKWKESIEI